MQNEKSWISKGKKGRENGKNGEEKRKNGIENGKSIEKKRGSVRTLNKDT
jgi:hypothetical protein